MRTGRARAELSLAKDDREVLKSWARRPACAQALALRARITLLCSEERTNTEVARQLRATRQTVGRWRQRFLSQRLDGWLDEPRPAAPRKVSDADADRVAVLTLEEETVPEPTRRSFYEKANAGKLNDRIPPVF